ncbi:hypothetical protein Tco_0704658 [Tanacetum coccineum]|uniref:Uncharacterized protein n=1 Tax=Tanacetum coccineum TaxID=301880 RepID=A0ABQ4Y487_9ASTR
MGPPLPTVEDPLKSSSNPSHEMSGLLYSLTFSPPTKLELHPILTPLPAFKPLAVHAPLPALFQSRFKETDLLRSSYEFAYLDYETYPQKEHQ